VKRSRGPKRGKKRTQQKGWEGGKEKMFDGPKREKYLKQLQLLIFGNQTGACVGTAVRNKKKFMYTEFRGGAGFLDT